MNKLLEFLLYKKWTKRFLTEEEHLGHLSQKYNVREKPRPYMCNLSINSNFIELVDIFHLTRGKLFLAIIPLFISIGFPLGMSFSITSGWTQLIEDEKIASSIFFLIVTIIFAIPMAWVEVLPWFRQF